MNKDIIATLSPSFSNNAMIVLSNITTLPEIKLPNGVVIAKIEDCCISVLLNKKDHNNIIKFSTSDNYIYIDPINNDVLYTATIEINIEKDDIRIVDFLHGKSIDLINNGSNIHEHIKTRLMALIDGMYSYYPAVMKIRTQSVHYQPQPT